MESKSTIDLKQKKVKQKKIKKDQEEENTTEMVTSDDSGSITPKSKPQSNKQSSNNSSNNKKRKKRDSASSDEERWLTAIESGKLEDVDDELKKIKPKDPALMTARQRAMYDRGGDGSPGSAPTLMSLPTGYKEKVMTAEAIQKAAIKSQKRKQLADEKREKDKKKTMERLLKKQESKLAKTTKMKSSKNTAPVIIYRQNRSSTIMKYPPNTEYPLKFARISAPPRPIYCSMNCGNLKKYNCSQTGVPLCSLECYKKNIASRIL